MPNYSKTLQDKSGMTLVEVMMAVAVFGIILLFIIQLTTTGSSMIAANAHQVRMAELAQAEVEKIKSNPSLYPTDPNDINKPINYPTGSTGAEVEQTYAILYQKDVNEMLKITVGPITEPNNQDPLDLSNPDNYIIVTWLP